ncbi:recombination mediator RecR, partial [Methylicorpusculum sp.]|uniref:recombination mediator RecR n=1 Tax=Methylicorpusculum sp. TaxID=2713644 RepID=UPI002ABC9E42
HMDEREIEHFCALLLQAKNKLVRCDICFCWREKDRACSLCSSIKRDQQIICAVETWQELLAIEKTGGYQGVYHVLGGVICPLEGVGPEDLTIKDLVERVPSRGVKEVILAFNQTPEGEATAAYIAAQLKPSGVLVSCLARGVPVGSSLETIDRVTVYKALCERRPF